MQKSNGMKSSLLVTMLILISTILFFAQPVHADDWRYALGISYMNVYSELADTFEKNLDYAGVSDTEEGAIPAGINFQPYLQFDNGMRIGVGLGPCSYMYGNVDYIDTPVNFNVGYTFNNSGSISPYFRMGFIRHIIAGDYVKGTDPGFFGAVGVEFLRDRSISYGLEMVYDTCEIRAESKKEIRWTDITGTAQVSTFVSSKTERYKVALSFNFYVIF
ncbi:MAG: hypothetical protein JXO48_01880 [Deltaproteobacteria bacterium]|nr:hypothetical protein [Deltaproteobacteria bacterium]